MRLGRDWRVMEVGHKQYVDELWEETVTLEELNALLLRRRSKRLSRAIREGTNLVICIFTVLFQSMAILSRSMPTHFNQFHSFHLSHCFQLLNNLEIT